MLKYDKIIEKIKKAEELTDRLKDNTEWAHTKDKSIRTELCVKGESMHRGFYHPSPFYDLFVGNTYRGKVLKRINKRSKPSHEYYFSADNKLLLVKLFCGRYKQLINYEKFIYDIIDDTTYRRIGVCYCNNSLEAHLSIELFNNDKIVEYEYCVLYDDNTDLTYKTEHYFYENYRYNLNGIVSVEMCDVHRRSLQFISNKIKKVEKDIYEYSINNHDEFVFQRDKNGELSKYTVNHYLSDRKANEYLVNSKILKINKDIFPYI